MSSPHALLAANRRFWADWAGENSNDDLLICRTGMPKPLDNGVLRAANKIGRADIARAHERLAGVPWTWWVGEDSAPGTADILLAQGARETGELPVMAVGLAQPIKTVRSENLRLSIDLVEDRAARIAFATTYAGPLGFSRDMLPAVIDAELTYTAREDSLVRLNGLVDGETVATAAVHLATEVAAIYFVATNERYRRRGIASAMTAEAMRIARAAGKSAATLQASAHGAAVYHKLGFRTVSRYRLFRFLD